MTDGSFEKAKEEGKKKSLKCGSRQRRLKRLINKMGATLINNLTSGDVVRLLFLYYRLRLLYALLYCLTVYFVFARKQLQK